MLTWERMGPEFYNGVLRRYPNGSMISDTERPAVLIFDPKQGWIGWHAFDRPIIAGTLCESVNAMTAVYDDMCRSLATIVTTHTNRVG